MKKRYSLKKRRDFQKVYRRGTAVASKYCVLISSRSRFGMLKVGFSASKKIGNSVQRNRAKRLMREAFRAEMANLRTDRAYIVVARSPIVEANMEEVRCALRSLMEKSGVLVERHEEVPAGPAETV
ncbi:MAG: ribonuclease P protein component [Eubacteriales bacterium]|nr:ribonuclease P protein component [Eubacteriales bacterium]